MKKIAETLDDADAAYGGDKTMSRSFRLKLTKGATAIANWKSGGVPRSQHLGLYLGLKARGYVPTPQLFGVVKWTDIPGVAVQKDGSAKRKRNGKKA